jgi:hypothetical protein
VSLPYIGYVRTDRGAVLVQIPDDGPHGFALADDDRTWPGGLGIATSWVPLADSDVDEDDRERIGWLLDEHRPVATTASGDRAHCQCGQWSGVRCQWEGPRSETVAVEFMPEAARESHRAAGNSGVYPHNGALRIRVERSCAEHMAATDGEWVEILA